MEDPLLLNIVSTPATTIKKKITGGRWTDRVKQQKKQVRVAKFQQRIAEPVLPTGKAPEDDRHAGHFQDDSQDRLTRKRKRSPIQADNDSSSLPPKKIDKASGQVVSSLFDYNDPLPPMAPTKKQEAAPKPVAEPVYRTGSTFSSFHISPELIQTMADKMQVSEPTTIQSKTLPVMCKTDQDVFIKAETGSGKTLAYLLPIVQRLSLISAELQKRETGTYALLIAPTRELAQQIYTVLDKLLNSHLARWMVGVLLIGGEKKKSEKARIRKGATIIIATPGRLKDHLDSTQALNMTEIRWVVLDEGDRLMDLGFEASIIDILSIIRDRSVLRNRHDALPERQITVICSATAKDNVKSLGEQQLKDAVFVEDRVRVSLKETSENIAPSTLKQECLVTPTKLRLVCLYAALKSGLSRRRPYNKIIVFFSCADTVDYHFSIFTRSEDTVKEDATLACRPGPSLAEGVEIFKLHGSLAQPIRTSTLQAFAKSTKQSVLFCTDVASRGLDLQVDHVVQYDPPFSVDDYTHRIGRTARAGKSGTALIFLLKSELPYIETIQTNLGSQVDDMNVKFLLKSALGADFEDAATQWQLAFEKWANSANIIERAKSAFTSHVRAYATHISSERKCFPIHELQLGHVAKSFGLRDAPSNVGRSLPKKRKVHNAKDAQKAEDAAKYGPTEIQTRMRQSIAKQASASEFNLF